MQTVQRCLICCMRLLLRQSQLTTTMMLRRYGGRKWFLHARSIAGFMLSSRWIHVLIIGWWLTCWMRYFCALVDRRGCVTVTMGGVAWLQSCCASQLPCFVCEFGCGRRQIGVDINILRSMIVRVTQQWSSTCLNEHAAAAACRTLSCRFA